MSDKILAAGTSESVRKSWETRKRHANHIDTIVSKDGNDNPLTGEDALDHAVQNMPKGATHIYHHADGGDDGEVFSYSKGSLSSKEAADSASHYAQHDFHPRHVSLVWDHQSATKATDHSSAEVIRAAGTSEGAKKGWEARFKGAMPNHKPHELAMYVQLREGGDSHGDAMRTIEGERQMASYQQSRGANKATDHSSAEVIRAAGTSEGVKKSWDARRNRIGSMIKSANDELGEESHSWLMSAKAKSSAHAIRHTNMTQGGDGPEAEAHKASADAFRTGKPEHHKEASLAHKHAAENQSDSQSEQTHRDLAEMHELHSHTDSAKASEATALAGEIIHCRSHAGVALTASEEWVVGQPTQFMWMPAGLHTIVAGFRDGSIELCVQCDQSTLGSVQASLDNWRANRPKQEPFGCIEHREQEASVRVGASCGFEWREDGVYLAAEPTRLGADNVNGRVHRSWSPSFTTDADYSKAVKSSGVLRFPDGVRGSASNPARITGVDFCVGTLTNKPAFHAMSPVKASEGEETVQATWSDAARKAAAESRKAHAGNPIAKRMAGLDRSLGDESPSWLMSTKTHDSDVASKHTSMSEASEDDSHESRAHQASAIAFHTGTKDAHAKAAELHHKAADNQSDSQSEEQHRELAKMHTHHAGASAKATDATPTPDTIAARHQEAMERANQIGAGQDALKLSINDIYERHAVTATGTSGGAKKGWEKRKADFMELHKDMTVEQHNEKALEHGKLADEAYFDKKDVSAERKHSDLSELHNEAAYEKSRPKKLAGSTPADILEKIYARAGANR